MRSKVIENHSICIEGVMNSDEDIISMDISNIGRKKIKDYLESFNGKSVKLTVRLSEEIGIEGE